MAYNFGCRALYNLPWRASVSSHQVQCNIPTFEALLRKYTYLIFERCRKSNNIWLRSLMQSDCLYLSLFFENYNHGRINHWANQANAQGFALLGASCLNMKTLLYWFFNVFRLLTTRQNCRAFWLLHLVHRLRKLRPLLPDILIFSIFNLLFFAFFGVVSFFYYLI